jgi:hypothetical protein
LFSLALRACEPGRCDLSMLFTDPQLAWSVAFDACYPSSYLVLPVARVCSVQACSIPSGCFCSVGFQECAEVPLGELPQSSPRSYVTPFLHRCAALLPTLSPAGWPALCIMRRRADITITWQAVTMQTAILAMRNCALCNYIYMIDVQYRAGILNLIDSGTHTK